MAKIHEIPANLKPKTKAWIQKVLGEYVLEDHHVKLLILAGQAWDRSQEARLTLKKEGILTTNRFDEVRPHPAVQIERDSSVLFARLIRELGLDLEDSDGPRIPRQY